MYIGMKNEKIAIMEVSDRLIKVCQVTGSKKIRIVDFLDVYEIPEEISSEKMSEFFSGLPQAKRTKLVLSLSRRMFLMRYLTLPSQEKQEIKTMLPFQLGKIVIHPIQIFFRIGIFYAITSEYQVFLYRQVFEH